MGMTLFALLALTTSGLLAGALLTEACVLVPYWKKMSPEEFLRLHSTVAPILFRFYAPLTVLGTVLPIAVCATLWATAGPATWPWTGSAACAIGLLGFYFGFFRQANIQFAEEQVPKKAAVTLDAWATMHQARTVVAVLGFVFAGIALSGG